LLYLLPMLLSGNMSNINGHTSVCFVHCISNNYVPSRTRRRLSWAFYTSGPFNTVTPPPPTPSGMFVYVFKAQMKEIINGIAEILHMAVSPKLVTHPTTWMNAISF